MGVEITKDIAKQLFAAISSDTGSSKYSNVRPETFTIAAELIKMDIDHAEIARKLFDTEDLKVVKFKGHLMNNLEQYFDGKLNIVLAPDSLISEYGIEEKDTGDIVNIPRGVSGCEIAVSIREAKDKIKLSFRSNGKYHVSTLAEKFGGGGHIMAAGAAVRNKSMEQVKEEVIKYCEEVLNG
jgi:phosphoesterase RecJ-like protein